MYELNMFKARKNMLLFMSVKEYWFYFCLVYFIYDIRVDVFGAQS